MQIITNEEGKSMDVLKKERILIIEDNELNLKVLTDILRKDYTLYAAKEGEDGIKKAKKYIPDLILLDIVLPQMDGYEVIEQLKNIPETRDIPIIFITSCDNLEDEKKGLALGAVDYITKPIDKVIVRLRVGIHIKILRQLRTIEQLSTTDQLTGMANRRGFDIRLNIEWDRAKRYKKPMGLLMIDIDHFKRYNDTYGHLQGDEALKAIAKAIENTFKRAIDHTARWGGEEFIVLLPETDEGNVAFLAELLRLNIEQTVIEGLDDLKSKVTVSIGAYIYCPTHKCSIIEFIARADEALYKAKQGGRNRVVIYESNEPSAGKFSVVK
jgi:diguanylate cyclase (GGDEF)-like protein